MAKENVTKGLGPLCNEVEQGKTLARLQEVVFGSKGMFWEYMINIIIESIACAWFELFKMLENLSKIKTSRGGRDE